MSLRSRSTSAPLRPITMPGRAVRMNTQIWSPLRSMSIELMPARDSRERMCLRIQMSSCSCPAYSRRPAYQLDFQG